MQAGELARTICVILCLSIVTIPAFPSAVAAPTAYIPHENPYNVTAVSGNIDYKTMAVLYDLYFSLNKVANDIKASDFKKAKIDYRSFYALYSENYNVIARLFSSESDAADSIEAMNITAGDISSLLDDMDIYNEDFNRYSMAVARGDTENATIYAARLQGTYKKLSSLYDTFDVHSTVAIDSFYNTNYGNIDASPLYPLRQVADDYMAGANAEYQNISTEYGTYKLTLSANKSDTTIGDTIAFSLFLAKLDASPVPGKAVTLYVDDAYAGRATTGSDGRCTITYAVPHGVVKDTLAVYAESYPQSNSIPPMLSNKVQLQVRDEPTSLTLSYAPRDAAFGDGVHVSGTLTMGDGSPVPPGEVDVHINGVKAGGGRTNGNGAYDYGFAITQSTPGGNCTINAVFTQSPGEIYLSSASPAGPINISVLDTALTLDIPGDRFGNGDTVNFTGDLVAENGMPVGGAHVRAYIDEARLGENTTDARGNYTIPVGVPYGMGAGNHTFYASYEPGNTSLRGTSSERLNVTVVAVEPVISVDGVPPILFKGDALVLTGSVLARNGDPIAGQRLDVNLSDAINGVVSTDGQGRFNFSQAVPGSDLPGIRQLTISPASADVAARRFTFYGGSILVIPMDKGVVAALILAVAALMIIALLLIWHRGTLGRLLRPTGHGSPAEPEPVPREDERPVADKKPPGIPDFGQLAGRIRDMRGTGDYRGTSRSIYLASRDIYASCGFPVSGASTHTEFYREMAARDPDVAAPLKLIVDLYEKTNFGLRTASEGEMESAYRGLYDVYMAATKGRETPPA